MFVLEKVSGDWYGVPAGFALAVDCSLPVFPLKITGPYQHGEIMRLYYRDLRLGSGVLGGSQVAIRENAYSGIVQDCSL